MNQEYITALVRHTLTAVGGFAVARGVTDQPKIDAIVGGAVALAGLVWSLLHKKALIATQPSTPTQAK